jgi:hypothetical protein
MRLLSLFGVVVDSITKDEAAISLLVEPVTITVRHTPAIIVETNGSRFSCAPTINTTVERSQA